MSTLYEDSEGLVEGLENGRLGLREGVFCANVVDKMDGAEGISFSAFDDGDSDLLCS
jgi:hypothetical protein